MSLSFLEPLYEQPGPFASVYLDTSRDAAIDDPDAALQLRWRHLRDALMCEGTDRDSITAVAGTVGSDADVPGTHRQAMFTAHGRLALLDELPAPPTRDTACFGTLPDTMPLIVQHASGIPYLGTSARRHGDGAYGAHRRQRRPDRTRPQPAAKSRLTCESRLAIVPSASPVRGARRAGGGDRTGPRLVHPTWLPCMRSRKAPPSCGSFAHRPRRF
ncbi:hypothetical protein ACWCQN_29995 [Streptomyces sp. NPDC001984]